jgi:hypothetical protein
MFTPPPPPHTHTHTPLPPLAAAAAATTPLTPYAAPFAPHGSALHRCVTAVRNSVGASLPYLGSAQHGSLTAHGCTRHVPADGVVFPTVASAGAAQVVSRHEQIDVICQNPLFGSSPKAFMLEIISQWRVRPGTTLNARRRSLARYRAPLPFPAHAHAHALSQAHVHARTSSSQWLGGSLGERCGSGSGSALLPRQRGAPRCSSS